MLLYKPSGLIGDLICLKTWSRFSHCEVACADGKSVASRDGIGVGVYPTRYHDLGAVLRPVEWFDYFTAMGWFFAKANGQKYAFLSLFAFWFAKWKADPKRMFCSEFATNFYRAGGLHLLHPEWSADQVAPGTFMMLPTLEHLWIA